MRHYLTLVFVSAWAISLANAAPTTCPSSGTYATLMGLNTAGGCTIDNLVFSNFTFASTAAGRATAIAPSDLVISGVLNSAPSAVGFEFAGIPMVAQLGQTSDVTLGYTVAAASGEPIVTSAALTEAGQAIPDTGVATIDETVDSSALQTYFASTLAQKPSDSVSFFSTASVGVSDHLHAAGGIVGRGQITGFSNTFDEAEAPVPETLRCCCWLVVLPWSAEPLFGPPMSEANPWKRMTHGTASAPIEKRTVCSSVFAQWQLRSESPVLLQEQNLGFVGYPRKNSWHQQFDGGEK